MPDRPKILCIRLSAMGDVLVTTPVYRALHEQLGAEVHVLTKAAFAPVLAHNPHVAQLHFWTDSAPVDALRAERFDLVVDLHGNIRSHLLRARLGVPVVGFRKRNLEKSLLPRGINLLGREHLLDRYFRALRPLGICNDGRGLDYFPQADELAAAEARTAPLRGPYVALVLGAAHATKRIVPEVIAGVIEALELPVVLLGGGDVTDLSAEVRGLLRTNAGEVLDLCGALPLRESIAVLAKAAGVVAGDTGLVHFAAALRRPGVVVWGNTTPSIGMYPHYPADATALHADAEVEGLACRPCSRIGFPKCPQGHFRCMREQRPRDIAAALGRRMRASATPEGPN